MLQGCLCFKDRTPHIACSMSSTRFSRHSRDCLCFYVLGQSSHQSVNCLEFNWGCRLFVYLLEHECRVFHGQPILGISTPLFHYFDMVPSVPEFTCGCSRFVEFVVDILIN